MKSYEISHAADLNALATFRNFVAGVCAGQDVHEDVVWAFQLSIDEAVTNVVEHGMLPSAQGKLTLRLAFTDKFVQAELLDNGTPFDPKTVAKPDISVPVDERAPGGLGVFFIYQMMDDVSYRITDDENVLVLRKDITAQDGV